MQSKKVGLMRKFFFLLFTFFSSFFLNAEIIQVIAYWDALKCLDYCTPRIRANFSAIQGVGDLQLNAPAGSATIEWISPYPFSYQLFYYAAAAAGINLNDLSILVKGKIVHDPANIYLISDGDQLRFTLIGPVKPTFLSHRPSSNIALHPLSQELVSKLLEIENRRETITIFGTLFAPRKYPNTLIVQQIKVLNETVQEKEENG